MSLFPRGFPTGGDFAPLFRLLDDYDVHRNTRHTPNIPAFQPKFDVREIKDAYELHGELPGIEQKDINIEFTDPQTLIIRGRTERHSSSGTPGIEDGHQQGRIEADVTDKDHSENDHSKKATVEDEDASSAVNTPTASAPETEQAVTKQSESPKYKYWVTERSIGEFHRSFSFPSRVDQDAVKASLKNGILSITVPKANAPQLRKVNIE